MHTYELTKGVHAVGAIDPERTLFDQLIPLPQGTSYNSYLVKGSEKTALIDTVDPSKFEILAKNLEGIEKIDYVIAHHAEQDHSGSIPAILEKFPKAQVVTSAKAKDFLIKLLHIPNEKFLLIKDGETLSLGDKTLRFVFTPWVHWPETMSTYLEEDKILFTCDWFGAHIADGGFAEDTPKLRSSAKRYYAEIMMPYKEHVRNNLEKISMLDIKMIAPSHGPVYRNPDIIIDQYKEWVAPETKNLCVIAYTSMHGSTEFMAKYLETKLKERSVNALLFSLPDADIGELAIALVDARSVLVGSPTVLAAPHPYATFGAAVIGAVIPKAKYYGIFGSHLWSGRAVEIITSLLPRANTKILPPVLIKGLPEEKDLALLDALAEAIAEKHKDKSN